MEATGVLRGQGADVPHRPGATWAPFDGTGLPSGGALQLGFDEGPPAILHVGTDTGVFSYELEAIDPTAIFSDGFESGETTAWSSADP